MRSNLVLKGSGVAKAFLFSVVISLSIGAFAAPVILDTQPHVPPTQGGDITIWSYTAPAGTNRILVLTASCLVSDLIASPGNRAVMNSANWGSYNFIGLSA